MQGCGPCDKWGCRSHSGREGVDGRKRCQSPAEAEAKERGSAGPRGAPLTFPAEPLHPRIGLPTTPSPAQPPSFPRLPTPSSGHSWPCPVATASEHSTHHTRLPITLTQGHRLPGDQEPPGAELRCQPHRIPGPSTVPASFILWGTEILGKVSLTRVTKREPHSKNPKSAPWLAVLG